LTHVEIAGLESLVMHGLLIQVKDLFLLIRISSPELFVLKDIGNLHYS
jgi:hypothetical protein